MPIFGKRVGGFPDNRFIMEIKTDNAGTSGTNQFTIPTRIGSTYNYDLHTSDGQSALGLTGNHTITFPAAGNYDIYISGTFPQFIFDNGGDCLKVLDIKNWGFYPTGSDQFNAFRGCQNGVITSLTNGNFAIVTSLAGTWRGWKSLIEFPYINSLNVANFSLAWNDCPLMSSFPLIPVNSATTFQACWANCLTLSNFPQNFFDGSLCVNFADVFTNTGLSQSSIDGVLVSINSNGTSNGTFKQSGGSAPSATGEAAITAMRSRGWTVTVTGGF